MQKSDLDVQYIRRQMHQLRIYISQIVTEDMKYDASVLNRKKKALKQLDKIQKLMKEGDDIHINTK